ncbi:MAG: alpha/beta fold hydrolase [Opitutales bacterium]
MSDRPEPEVGDDSKEAGVPCAFPLDRQLSLSGRCHPGARNRPSLLALHGFLGSGADWLPVIRHLNAGTRPAPSWWTVDLPGHGNSRLGAPARQPFPESVDRFLHPLIQAISDGEQPLILIGYSLGGRLALHCALDPVFSQRLAGLVLISASPGLSDPGERTARIDRDAGWAHRFREEPLERVLPDWDAQPVLAPGPAADTRLEQAFCERRATQDGRQLAWALEAFSPGRLPGLQARLPGLACPVLWLTGEADAAYARVGRVAAQVCPRGRHRAVPQASHRLLLEAPGAVAGALGEFLDLHRNRRAD